MITVVILMFGVSVSADSAYEWPEYVPEVETKVSQEINAVITAYNENDGDTPGTTMANGEEVRYGTLANDVLPLGTKVEINGEIFEICDRFGGNHSIERFDMYLPTVEQCESWGVQEITVRILEED